jgi:predicted permease
VTSTAFAALIIILLGWLLGHLGVLARDAGQILVRIVLYLALPALVFRIMVTSDFDRSMILAPVVGLIVHVLLVGAALLVGRIRALDRGAMGALIVASAVGNTGFFGIPLIAAAAAQGSQVSLSAAVMFDTFSTGIITWTSTIWFGARYGEAAGSEATGGGAIWRNLLLPPIWAVAAGLALHAAGVRTLPTFIDQPLGILGAAVLPLVLIYAGLVLDWGGVRRAWKDVLLASALRLVLSPLLVFAVAILVGLEGDVLRTVVLMGAMPTAMMSLVIGGWFKLRTDIIAGSVVVTALLAPVMLPLFDEHVIPYLMRTFT